MNVPHDLQHIQTLEEGEEGEEGGRRGRRRREWEMRDGNVGGKVKRSGREKPGKSYM